MTEQPEQQQTVQQTEDQCAFPDCDRPRVPKDPAVRGTRPRYCDDPNHNASSAFKERRAREATAAGRVQPVEEDLDRPVSTAAATRVHVGTSVLDAVKTLEAQLPRYLEILEQLDNTEAVEAEVHTVSARADSRVAEAQKQLTDERTLRKAAERRVKTAEDNQAEADEAAAEAHRQLEEAKARFEAETTRIQDEATAAVTAAQEDRNTKVEQAAADAAERIDQVEKRTAKEVADIEQKAGEERVERDRQLTAMQQTVEAEKKAAKEVKAQSLRDVEEANGRVVEATGRAEEAQTAARQATNEATARVAAAKELTDQLGTELDRVRGDLKTAAERITTLETKNGEQYEEIRTLETRARDAEEKLREAKRQLKELQGPEK